MPVGLESKKSNKRSSENGLLTLHEYWLRRGLVLKCAGGLWVVTWDVAFITTPTNNSIIRHKQRQTSSRNKARHLPQPAQERHHPRYLILIILVLLSGLCLFSASVPHLKLKHRSLGRDGSDEGIVSFLVLRFPIWLWFLDSGFDFSAALLFAYQENWGQQFEFWILLFKCGLCLVGHKLDSDKLSKLGVILVHLLVYNGCLVLFYFILLPF